jgi:hypothetical protein
MDTSTVKSSNFGPHLNFGPFFYRKACYYQNASYKEMNRIKFLDKLSICKVGSVYFWHRIFPKKLRILQDMVQSFNEVQS